MSETRAEEADATDPDPEPEPETTETDEADGESETEERVDDHLDGVDAGCGCAEVWETLSEQREE